MRSERQGYVIRKPHFLSAVSQRFDHRVNKCRSAPAQRSDDVNLLFLDFHDNADRAENLARHCDIFVGRARTAGECSRRATDGGRRVRQRAHQPQVRGRFHCAETNTGRERNGELIPADSAETAENGQHHRRLHADKNDFRRLCDLSILCGYIYPHFRQRGPRLLIRLARDNFIRPAKFRAEQAADHRAGQLARADEPEAMPSLRCLRIHGFA